MRFVPALSQSVVLENVCTAYDRLYLVLVKARSLAGEYTTSPFDFQHCNIRKIVLSRGYERFILDDIDFNKHKEGAAYLNTLKCLDKHVPLTVEEFANGKTIFSFILSPTDPTFALPTPREDAVRIELFFSTPPTDQIAAIVLNPRPKIMEITASREVKLVA